MKAPPAGLTKAGNIGDAVYRGAAVSKKGD